MSPICVGEANRLAAVLHVFSVIENCILRVDGF